MGLRARSTLERSKRATTLKRAEDVGGKREQTRQRILKAAFKLIGHEHGVSVRVEQICAEAGISKGTFYNYFSSLEALFQALTLDLSHEFNWAVVATLSAIEGAAEYINAAIQHYLERTRRDPAWGWAMVHLSSAGPLLGLEAFQAAQAVIEKGIAAGEFDVEQIQCGRDLTIGTCLAAMITVLREGGDVSRQQTVARHVLRGLGLPSALARKIAARPLPKVKYSSGPKPTTSTLRRPKR